MAYSRHQRLDPILRAAREDIVKGDAKHPSEFSGSSKEIQFVKNIKRALSALKWDVEK